MTAIRTHHTLAPGVTVEISITADHQVQLVAPSPLVLAPAAMAMLAQALERAAANAAARKAARDARRAAPVPRLSIEQVVEATRGGAADAARPAAASSIATGNDQKLQSEVEFSVGGVSVNARAQSTLHPTRNR